MSHTYDQTAERDREALLEQARHAGNKGSFWATAISGLALLFSGYSLYETVLRAPDLAIHVPPRIDYSDPDGQTRPFEVFVIPLTVTNSGARSATLLSIDLKVTNPETGESKTFYAANTGTWGNEPREAFAPVSLPGRGSFSKSIQFFPRQGEEIARITQQEAGSYQFELNVNVAAPKGPAILTSEIQPLRFEMQSASLDYRLFSHTSTMAMWAADYAPAVSASE